MNAPQPNQPPRSLHEWEGFWRNQLRSNAHKEITDGERIGIEVQAYAWAYQSVHGRGVVPRDLLLKKLANVLGFPPAFVTAAWNRCRACRLNWWRTPRRIRRATTRAPNTTKDQPTPASPSTPGRASIANASA